MIKVYTLQQNIFISVVSVYWRPWCLYFQGRPWKYLWGRIDSHDGCLHELLNIDITFDSRKEFIFYSNHFQYKEPCIFAMYFSSRCQKWKKQRYLHWAVQLFFLIFSRPGRSQGLLYKHLCYWFNNWLIRRSFS